MSEVARVGPFVIFEPGDKNNDYVLTDKNESVYFGFNTEETSDLIELLEEINYEA